MFKHLSRVPEAPSPWLLIVAGLLVAQMLTGSACAGGRRPQNIDLRWKNVFTWEGRLAEKKGVTRILAADEIQTIKRAALESLTSAFASIPMIRVRAGGRITDLIYVHNIERSILGESYICGAMLCPPSRVNYDLHMTLAQEYAKDLQITAHRDILLAIGRAIGTTAAHEFGHRYLLAGMDDESDPATSDPAAYTNGGIDKYLFYGGAMRWPPRTLADIHRKFPE